MCYRIFQKEKTPFWTIETPSSKSRKIGIFPNPWFWPKIGHFSIFFLGNIGQENVFYDILERKNAFLDYKNQTFKKSKTGISQRGQCMVLVKNWQFFHRFILGKKGQGNVSRYSKSKNAFLHYKNKKLKKWKNLTFFQRGYSMVFCQKWAIFSSFCLRENRREKCFTIFQKEKTPFKTIKTRSSKSP